MNIIPVDHQISEIDTATNIDPLSFLDIRIANGDRPLCFHSRADRIDMDAKLAQNHERKTHPVCFVLPGSPYVFVSPSCSNIAARSK